MRAGRGRRCRGRVPGGYAQARVRPTPAMAVTPPPPPPLPFDYAPPPAMRRRMRLRKTRLTIAVLAWLALGHRLALLRLHDGAGAGSPPVRGRPARAAVERRDLRRRRQDRARRAALRPVPRARALEGDLAGHAQRGGRGRGPALLPARRDRPGRHGPRRRRQHLDGHARAGRLHDHPAARQEPLEARTGRHALAAAQDHRGRARLPGRAALVEAEDPRGVPQHDLLRPPGLRRRGRRRGVLRRAREGPAAAAGRPARRPGAEPDELRPRQAPADGPERRTLVLAKLLQQGYIDAFEYRLADSKPLLPRGPADRLPAREEDDRELLRRLRAPAADQPLRAPARRSAAGCASTRRSTRACSAWRSRPCARRCRSAGPRRRWSRSTRPPARSRPWSAAATTRTPVYGKFNLATEAVRQPGSAFKIFVLLAALEEGILPQTRVQLAQAHDRAAGPRGRGRCRTTRAPTAG